MNGKRILLVEDEALIALDTEEALTEAGCHVLGPADRVDAALAIARSEDMDAAVLDVNLAGDYVWPVAEVLRARRIPFVLLSGFGTMLDAPPACSAAPRLGKPFVHTTLLSTLKSLCT